MDIITRKILMILPFTVMHALLVDTNEYCYDEPFEASCSASEVIVLTKATYGFMGMGRCVKFDFGINCTVDAKPYMDKVCALKRECQFRPGELDGTAPCLDQVRTYLIASYVCIPVETNNDCSSKSPVISSTSGFISSSVAREKGCGTIRYPWRINLLHGQSVEFQYANFMTSTTDEFQPVDNCKPIGFITNIVTQENKTICESDPTPGHLFKSNGQSVDVQMIPGSDSVSDYILQFKVTGCIDLLTPEFAWYERSRDDAIIGCKHRNMTWHLHCEDNRWNGVMGKCHNNKVEKTTVQMSEPSSTTGHQFVILVGIIAAIFITLLVCITVAVFKLIDRRNAKQLAKQQILLDSSTSHRYSGGPQRHDPLMYHERIEMVPDILENSLRRTYAPGKADSESSSQTNYPGTLYFMGTLGHNVQSPVVEAIPLPRKPASVSDSESEHLYDSIPADCT